jgi:hypothetical protein
MSDADYHARSQLRKTQKELEETKRRLEGQDRSRKRGKVHVEDHERELRFLTLMNRALLEVVIEAGLIDLDGFADLMRSLDEELDGKAGDGLSLSQLSDELGVDAPELDKKARFVRSLQKGRRRRPR